MDKLKKLGNRALAIPFGIAVALFCVLGLAMAPMMHMEPKNMPVAIVNLDEGADLPTGAHLVAGDLIKENIQELAGDGAGNEPPMKFTVLDSREELDERMADYYGAIVIPADFTEKRMAGSTALATTLGEGIRELTASQQSAARNDIAEASPGADPEAAVAMQQQAQTAMAAKLQGVVEDAVAAQQNADKPTVELVTNTAKSPIFANTMSGMATAMAQAGVQVEVTSIGDADGNASPIAGLMGVQMAVMPLMMLSLVMSLIAFVVTRAQDERRTRASKGRTAGVQAGYALAASLVAAVASYGIVAWFGGAAVPAQAILLLWLASACIMLANLGLLSIAVPFGALVMACVFALGLCTAVLPPEMLPPFWADWVYPWAPQVSIGNGLRNIIYLDGGAFDVGIPRLLAWGCAGLTALVVSIFIPSRQGAD